MDKAPRFPKGKSKKIKVYITKFWDTDGIIVATGVIYKSKEVFIDRYVHYECIFKLEEDCEISLEKAITKVKRKKKQLIKILEKKLLKLKQTDEIFFSELEIKNYE